ncbi:MAG: methyltransferase domain-containing protein [Ignavibacteriaceae bacterium]|jgi:ubiquinone/menaquinone biosynthesis C-methylase UbiE|nr:methyltransferase domain-containing protein [Chlorobium sp.]MCW9096475.1 methyltransferase domain-containing protein [Ignavibacteriaceae bacterium]
MPRTEPFDQHPVEYEKWFNKHKYVYESEVEAVRHFIPTGKKGIEIGIGTGRFAIPFGITEGIEPSTAMGYLALIKGLEVHNGIAEELPVEDHSFDFALMVTTICFVDDVRKSFSEVKRILKPGGSFIIGLVDKNSPLGKIYEKLKEQNKFYRFATFYATDEIIMLLKENGFSNIETVQTVFGNLQKIHEVQKFKEGYGEGGFVVVNAVKAVNSFNQRRITSNIEKI